jgi:gas vesicle protein
MVAEEDAKDYENKFVDLIISTGEEMKAVKGEKSSKVLEPFDKMFTKIRDFYKEVLESVEKREKEAKKAAKAAEKEAKKEGKKKSKVDKKDKKDKKKKD